MTKRELMEMVKNYADDAELMFIEDASDGDGYPYDKVVKIYKVVSTNTKRIRKEYGIERYEEVE